MGEPLQKKHPVQWKCVGNFLGQNLSVNKCVYTSDQPQVSWPLVNMCQHRWCSGTFEEIRNLIAPLIEQVWTKSFYMKHITDIQEV